MAAPCAEAEGLDSPSARRVHFAMGAENAAVGANGLIKLPSCTPEATGWKIGAVERTPRTGSSGADCTPASAAWLESARKVDDLRERLEGLEEALRGMEAKAVQQLDKHLQEKVLATAMKLVERRFADGELNKKIEEKVLATAMKLVQRKEGSGETAEAIGDLAKKLEMDFESREETPMVQSTPDSAALMEQFAVQIESGLGQVVRRLERKVDALQFLVDNDVFAALEARVTEALGCLEQRVLDLEAKAGVPEPDPAAASSRGSRPAGPEASLQLRPGAQLLTSPATRQEALSTTASDAESRGAAPRQPTGAAAQQQGLAGIRRRPVGPKLSGASPAGTALQGALQAAKEQVARSEAAAAEAAKKRKPWWRALLTVLFWVLLSGLGLAACLAGMVAVATASGHMEPLKFLS